MKEPLAYRLRPETIDDILGQKDLVGENGIIRRCLEKQTIFSCIFFGPPGTGKTTMARVIANELHKPYRQFNAVTGNKKDLDQIFAEARLSGQLIMICDEVHRLNKDKQDLLLPHVEDGSVILIGATTANPYHSINPAIRSRCHLFEFRPLTDEDIGEGIRKALESQKGLNNEYTIEEDALHSSLVRNLRYKMGYTGYKDNGGLVNGNVYTDKKVTPFRVKTSGKTSTRKTARRLFTKNF